MVFRKKIFHTSIETVIFKLKTMFLSLMVLLWYHTIWVTKDFLLLNDSSHDPHFSACQNIETLDEIQKISNFSLHRFSRYLTPNMALQKIILTFFFSSFRLRAMRSSRHNFSKILSNRNEILQTCSGVNVVVPNTFWVHSVVRGYGVGGPQRFSTYDLF